MLVLSRKRDDRVIIDLTEHGLGLVEITTVEIRGDKVRYGIDADKDIPVHRHEVYEAIKGQQEDSAA